MCPLASPKPLASRRWLVVCGARLPGPRPPRLLWTPAPRSPPRCRACALPCSGPEHAVTASGLGFLYFGSLAANWPEVGRVLGQPRLLSSRCPCRRGRRPDTLRYPHDVARLDLVGLRHLQVFRAHVRRGRRVLVGHLQSSSPSKQVLETGQVRPSLMRSATGSVFLMQPTPPRVVIRSSCRGAFSSCTTRATVRKRGTSDLCGREDSAGLRIHRCRIVRTARRDDLGARYSVSTPSLWRRPRPPSRPRVDAVTVNP